MNRKIKSLLKLSRIPGFKLSQDDLKLLEDWKKQQEPIEIVAPKPKRKRTVPRVRCLIFPSCSPLTVIQ